ncbi:MAG: DUF2256 domain-containing protein [Phycisphaeraceae bacterium]|nr:DUF2256 domain-containing protein [Phycisphaeraceae bacterium]MBX3366500.1 DUF2256 domain-containing protein [Phycisphaeraceae bacterium]QYK47197.1 MAG: DUF2256 domain-containing protein [Phycisphaeraceae bacterium]
MKRRHDTPRQEKHCPVCKRPFQWRKKWERDWPHVLYCSDRCRREAARRPDASNRPT